MGKEKKVKLKKAVKMVSALAQETRMSVFRLLAAKREEGGMPAGVIAEMLGVPSATMSFHLSQLTAAGLLKSAKEGRQVFYSVKRKAVKGLIKFLEEGLSSPGKEGEIISLPFSSASEEDGESDFDDEEDDASAIAA
ncbi:MAG: metalloregulator ArsR/SmtB family transcription factor [Rickettsiales bacterium]